VTGVFEARGPDALMLVKHDAVPGFMDEMQSMALYAETPGLLDAADLRRGDRVAVWLPSRAESVVALLACARNGYVCSPSLHQNYTVAEIAQLLERTRRIGRRSQVDGTWVPGDPELIFGLRGPGR